MSITVRIPTPMRKLTNEEKSVEAHGFTVGEVIVNLGKKYPELNNRICDETGEVRRFVNLYLNDEDIRFKKGKQTEVADGDILSIIPAVAGGACVVSTTTHDHVR